MYRSRSACGRLAFCTILALPKCGLDPPSRRNGNSDKRNRFPFWHEPSAPFRNLPVARDQVVGETRKRGRISLLARVGTVQHRDMEIRRD